MDVPSPCVNICKLNPDQICTGCGRHIDEVIAWPSASEDQKLRILAAASERLARIKDQGVSA